MTFRVLMIVYRKPDLSPDQFREIYQEEHLPLAKSMAGALWPLEHRCTYLARSNDAEAGYPAVTFLGKPEDFEYDVVAELVFEDKDHFEKFAAKTMEEEFKTKLEESERTFIDKEKLRVVVLGETYVTAR